MLDKFKFSRVVKKLFYIEEWNIGIIKKKQSKENNIADCTLHSDIFWFKKYNAVQADPFVLEHNNLVYIFYESLGLLNSKGDIRCRVLDNDLKELDDMLLIGLNDIQCHLSYPFYFEHDGKLFLIPESYELSEVSLFECISFPNKWKKAYTLVSGIKLTDSSIICSNGKYYLYSTDLDNNLILHMSTDLFDNWKKISPNLKLCNQYARGAGSPLYYQDGIFIFTQEGFDHNYGSAIFIKKISSIGESEFSEELVRKIEPIIGSYKDGIHTINSSENYIVIDSKRLKFNLFSFFIKLVYKVKTKLRQCKIKTKLRQTNCIKVGP